MDTERKQAMNAELSAEASPLTIRVVTEKDTEQLLPIYRYYIDHTAISFEYTAPAPEEFIRRMRVVQETYPYLLAERDGKVLGYVYAGKFNMREAYCRSVETTIYLAPDCRKMGVGKKLYTALENCLREMNILNLNACISYPVLEDEYLNTNSVDFHQHIGYSMVGRFHSCGYKFHRWYDMVWMEKMLGEHPENPAPVKAFSEVRSVVFEKYGIR